MLPQQLMCIRSHTTTLHNRNVSSDPRQEICRAEKKTVSAVYEAFSKMYYNRTVSCRIWKYRHIHCVYARKLGSVFPGWNLQLYIGPSDHRTNIYTFLYPISLQQSWYNVDWNYIWIQQYFGKPGLHSSIRDGSWTSKWWNLYPHEFRPQNGSKPLCPHVYLWLVHI